QTLEGLKQKWGLVPNLAATMAESPTLLNGFVAGVVNSGIGTLSAAERQALLLTNAVANRCAWAVAFHSTIALQEGVAADDARALGEWLPPRERRLAARSTLSRALIEKRGHLAEGDLRSFLEAGFRRDQALEVIATLAVSVMANYAGNITQPPVEEPFQPQLW